jgi:hypothetical protein
MTIEIKNPYYVRSATCTYDCFETLAEAQEYARKDAWSTGSNQVIYKAFAVAEKPEQLKNIKITEL